VNAKNGSLLILHAPDTLLLIKNNKKRKKKKKVKNHKPDADLNGRITRHTDGENGFNMEPKTAAIPLLLPQELMLELSPEKMMEFGLPQILHARDTLDLIKKNKKNKKKLKNSVLIDGNLLNLILGENGLNTEITAAIPLLSLKESTKEMLPAKKMDFG